MVFGALLALVFLGSSGEGQASVLDTWFRNYVEEKAITLNTTYQLSSVQMADLNSIVAGTTTVTAERATALPSPHGGESAAINQSSLLAISPTSNDYLDQISTSRASVVEYEVQEGDLVSFIASDFGVSVNSILWANNIKNADSIKPGTVLKIPPVTGVIHIAKKGETVDQIAKRYGVDAEKIIAYNHIPKDGTMSSGEEVIVPGGVMPAVKSTAKPTTVPLLGTASVAKLSAAAKQFAHLPDLGSFFKVPTSGFNWGRIHGRNGVDIANSCGTSIAAAADGTVTTADGEGWNGGFGKYVKISHSNGTETLYAHASKLLVKNGQAVTKGESIMLMGTTGRSTGCHLHFEVHGARNPLAKN